MLRLLGLVLLLATAAPPAAADSPVTDSLTHYYTAQDAAAIARLYAEARTREERLLCSYRLYPLTNDDDWLTSLPSDPTSTSARELALIAAHWGYRAATAPAWRIPTYGRRAESILRRAQALDPAEPYVLLVEGQTLFYKPALFGGDVEAARARFEQLRNVLGRGGVPGLHPFEAEVWIWLTYHRERHPEADRLREHLLARQPPPLFRQFLLDPPA
ncbi:MAG: hypothetical protein HKN04_06455 [Rhodothermaceae bacterium]|nr:hypothetical protein [Rhodothermaceae bacterium]